MNKLNTLNKNQEKTIEELLGKHNVYGDNRYYPIITLGNKNHLIGIYLNKDGSIEKLQILKTKQIQIN